jgi:hypothetical protein
MATPFDPLTNLPARIVVADFKDRYLAAFPKFTNPAYDPILADAIESVYIMFDGVNTLWKSTDIETWCNKTGQCYMFLIAWYIVNMYPRMAAGIHSSGGIPVLSKKIGDVVIHYMDTSRMNTADSVLESLRSNPYGNMALTMIRSSTRRFTISVMKL